MKHLIKKIKTLSKIKLNIRDVAKMAGVSPATVSRYLNGKADSLTPSSRKLKEIISNTGFRCRSYLKTQINILAYYKANAAYMDHQYIFEKTLEDKLSASGINMIRINSKPDHKIISKYNISGMILIDSFPGLESLPVPSVLINRYGIRFPMYSCVECDELAGFVDGFKFLKEKGHRRIALFWEKQIRPIDKHARKCHPKDAYELNDLPYDKELVCAEDFVSGKHDLVIEKAVERWFSLQEPPTAIFSIGDTYVPAIYESLKKRGLKVPEDVSVMGYDNAPVCEMLYPKLTTVRKPMGKMAQEALKLLLSRINNRNPETENIIRILVRPDLVVRESVRDFLNP